MARVKNVKGGLGDEDPRPPPRLSAQEKGKAKKLTTKKRKYADTDTERAVVVAAATDCAERGAWSGVRIADQLSPAQRATIEQVERRHGSPARTVMLEGRWIALEESQPQGEPQQQAQPAEQTQEGEQVKEIEQAPQPWLCRSGRTRTPVKPRPETQRRGSRPPPRPQGPPPVTHLDLKAATAKQVQQLRFVDFEQWFPPRRDDRASEGFYIPL